MTGVNQGKFGCGRETVMGWEGTLTTQEMEVRLCGWNTENVCVTLRVGHGCVMWLGELNKDYVGKPL